MDFLRHDRYNSRHHGVSPLSTESSREAPEDASLRDLADLTELAERQGVRSLSGDDALRYGRLYRRAVCMLARVRTSGARPGDADRLNRLVARAYQVVYSAPEKSGGFRRFFSHEIPQALRCNLAFVLLAWAALGAGAAVAWVKTSADPAAAEVLVGRGWSTAIEQIGARHRERQEWLPDDARSVAGSFIVVNNIQVALVTFALGSLLGVGSLLMMLRTGAMLGAVGSGVAAAGSSTDFWAFVAAHGVPEITAIVLAGSAGMRLGWSLVDPGDYTRADAFRRAGHDSIRLVMACVIMLVWAAVVESFISPTLLPYSLKFGVAAGETLVMLLYFVLGGRQSTAPASG